MVTESTYIITKLKELLQTAQNKRTKFLHGISDIDKDKRGAVFGPCSNETLNQILLNHDKACNRLIETINWADTEFTKMRISEEDNKQRKSAG